MSNVQKVANANGTRKPRAAKATNPTPVPIKKKTFAQRAIEKAKTVVIKIKTTRGGRACIRVAKGTAIACGLYTSYKLGQRSIRPTVVTITEGVQETEQPEQETETQEQEETVETNDEEETEV